MAANTELKYCKDCRYLILDNLYPQGFCDKQFFANRFSNAIGKTIRLSSGRLNLEYDNANNTCGYFEPTLIFKIKRFFRNVYGNIRNHI